MFLFFQSGSVQHSAVKCTSLISVIHIRKLARRRELQLTESQLVTFKWWLLHTHHEQDGVFQ